MDMQNYTTPFANTGDREEFSIDTDPSGKVSLEKGWTELYQLRPEEGGLFILRKVFNQMMKLVSTDTVTWKTQTFPNWIDDKGDGLPFAYPKNAIVKATDGENYVSLIDDNEDNPIGSVNWSKFDLSDVVDKTTNQDIDGIKIFLKSPIVPTPTTGDSSTKVATTAFVKAKSEADSIGIGQTWQDLTASRSLGVTYTNTTGKPIEVSITSGSASATGFVLYIDSVNVQTTSINASTNGYHNFIVPNGSTYSLTGGTLAKWSELR